MFTKCHPREDKLINRKLKIFINYRREDEANIAFSIANSLMGIYGVGNVFYDRQAIPAGSEFPKEIDRALDKCLVFIPVIGKEWLNTMKKREAFEEKDYVMDEIEHALDKGVSVLPVLVDDTPMPSEKDLPPKLKRLSIINAINISSDPKRLPTDIELFKVKLDKAISKIPKRTALQWLKNILKNKRRFMYWLSGIAGIALLFILFNIIRKSPFSEKVITQKNQVADIDGNIYKIVTIGTQVWMAENLKTTKFNDGLDIPKVTDAKIWSGLSAPAYCWYNNDISNKDTYGVLYNGYSVITSKICPIGWHVPTDNEWYILENYLDPSINDPNAILWRGTDCGTKLKEGGLSGFKAKMGGAKILPPDSRDFGNINEMGYFFTSTDDGLNHLWARLLTTDPENHRLYPGNKVNRLKNSKNVGYSIRCIKDK
jgi:uncharacterized protein (TIGR02145 family)